MAEFPTFEQMAKDVAEKALDEILYNGKSIREWMKIIAEQELCEDCISREATINCVAAAGMCDPIITQKRIKRLPSVKPQAEWVPVSERLPEEYCLFCDIDGDVFYGHIYDGRWWAEGQDDRIKNVVAWMPMPEPYEESEG